MTQIRPYNKIELGCLYLPDLDPQSASHRLVAWIANNAELLQSLHESGYHKNQRRFTVKQVRLIFEHLGEP